MNALAPRQPLTDIFAPNPQIAPPTAHKNNAFYDKVAQFKIAEDRENAPQQENRPKSRSKSPQRVGLPGNTDSGYHGMTEDEMEAIDAEIDAQTEVATMADSQEQGESDENKQVAIHEDQQRPQPTRQATGRTSNESFMSAREEIESRNQSRQQARDAEEEDTATVPDENQDMELDQQPEIGETPAHASDQPPATEEEEPQPEDEDMEDEAPQSPSDTSSPEKPLARKSSFTFSSLPAREPLTAKRSVGGRNSQVDAGRHSVLAARATTSATKDEEQEKAEEAPKTKTSTQSLHERIMMLGKTKEPRTSKSIPQSVLNAQAMYPQLPPAEADEALANTASQPESFAPADDRADVEDDDDDWIAPSKPTQATQPPVVAQFEQQSYTPVGSPARPAMHAKSISTTNLPSPSRPVSSHGHSKAQSVSNASLANAAGVIASTTPAGTPAKKHHDGPISASKSKLWSALKSARSIFASSASTSAAAKVEAHSPQRSPTRDVFAEQFKESTQDVYTMPGAMYSNTNMSANTMQPPPSPTRPASAVSASPSRKTRSSTESDKRREKEAKAAKKAHSELERAREKERAKVAKEQEDKRKADEAEAKKRAVVAEKEKLEREKAEQQSRPGSSESEAKDDTAEVPAPAPTKSMLPAGKLRAPGRLMRPGTREPPQANSKPVPVNIRVASQSQRLGQSVPQSNMGKSQHGDTAPPPPPKTGLRTTSAQGNARASTAQPANNARVRALEAAARKKEADEKAAAKKLEQKRELERKRAARAEEERRAEEGRKAAERAKAEEARLEKQRKLEEQRKREQARLAEQRRFEEERAREEERKAQAARDLAESIKRERAAAAPAHPRGDVGGTLRQLSKQTVPVNHAKPAKRVFNPEEDDEAPPQLHRAPSAQAQRPGIQRGPPSYQQNDAKRRRTIEEDEAPTERHSVMAPPKRPSNMRKVNDRHALRKLVRSIALTGKQESTLKAFPHGYSHAPQPAIHHNTSMFKSTVTAQHQLHHAGKPMHPSQTVQMSSARIPFAENANPPATAQHSAYQQHHGIENAHPSGVPGNKFKTPARPAQAPKSAKSSPAYPKGDNIELPDIQTDSEEEEDSEDEATGGFRAPSWVASPALRELLTQQQLVDPETVFGPIPDLKMEEVFKGGKNPDRVKKFRDRGSSARWVETGDAVTSAEKRRDMEKREKFARDGGWRYEPS